MLLTIYATTLFLSAALMFAVQPMLGKMVLPLLGGSPAVWNTEVAFCQGVLLLGYLYAHLTARWLGVRWQAVAQCFLILLPLLVLPIGIVGDWTPPTEENPVSWLLLLLVAVLGLPFFVVATTSPMLQKWFASTSHPKARDPYFLYAASNAGSLLGLLGYPVLLEPYFHLKGQSLLWEGGYGLLVLLMAACAVSVWRSPGADIREKSPLQGTGLAPPPAENREPLTARRRIRWVLFAFVPSSLMLSVTTYLSTNISPVPLFWVIPLSIYLLTLILVFARRTFLPQQVMVRTFPIVMLPLVIVIILQATQPIWLMFLLHLIAFFVTAMVCHGAVATDRPATIHLTEFYLWISLGGVLGGVFNALLAPVLFSTLLEYPLALVLSGLLLVWAKPRESIRYGWVDLALPAGLAVLFAGLILGFEALQLTGGSLSQAVTFGVPAVLCYSLSTRPLRFGLGLGALLLASGLYSAGEGDLIYRERNFFGVHRVLHDPQGRYHVLSHSGTLHGKQSLEASRRCEPLAYYHPSGPLGQLFTAFRAEAATWRVAAVGLGAGSIASYSQPGQRWTFYEIDPTVVRLARDRRYFSFLSDCGPDVRVVLGDARLSLAKDSSRRFDVLILDAYSSDSIPVHMITREALELYLDRISEDGLLIFHISNQYLDLRPVLGNLAQDAGLVCLLQNDLVLSEEERSLGKEPSQWVVMARNPEELRKLADDPRWQTLKGSG
ncbi:fused MFS/spermidine synthase, partial [Acidobacteria bacterium AH-259-G07]|nr:fused MFS/spermidine synthase [Acidobacteria bacterium AH-259-G07]